MVRGSFGNYTELHRLLLLQHQASAHKPYPWEYWPREEGRSECGYVSSFLIFGGFCKNSALSRSG